jgi:uncharacterized protein YqeY
MSVFEQLQADLKAARLARDEHKSDTLRTLIGDIQLEATRPGAKPIEEITQQKLKSFTDSANDFIGNTSDEAIKATKQAEIAIYAAYRPKQMTEDELRVLLTTEFGATLTQKQKGQAMGFLNKGYKGQFDGTMAAGIVDAMIAAGVEAAKAAA